MIKSMTGFGKGEASVQNKKITVEVRSLNSKQLDHTVKLPSAYRRAEYDLRNLVSKALQRGKVDLFASVESPAAETSAHINKQAFDTYYTQIAAAFADHPGLSDAEGVKASIVPYVLRLHDVIAAAGDPVS